MKRGKWRPLKIQRGRFIGEGGYKRAYTVRGRRDRVVLIHYEDPGFEEYDPFTLIKDERKHLLLLRRLGLPVADILDVGYVNYGGKRTVAHTMERYACGNRDSSPELFLRIFNERTLNQAREMLRTFAKLQPLFVDDLQFLFRRDGSFVIADPLFVRRSSRSTEHCYELWKIARGAAYALAVKSGAILHPISADFWDASAEWCTLSKQNPYSNLEP